MSDVRFHSFHFPLANADVVSWGEAFTKLSAQVKTELVRKSLHFLIALSPVMASYNRSLTMMILALGTMGYAYMETLRMAGVRVPVISPLTRIASRERDQGRFVMGPVTLGVGALLAMLLYPSVAASIAIYALAFGDGFASLIGKFFGRIRPRILCGKSVEGSSACFIAVFVSSFCVSHDLKLAFIAAFTAAAVEALPLEDYDNVALPVTVGLVVKLVLFL